MNDVGQQVLGLDSQKAWLQRLHDVDGDSDDKDDDDCDDELEWIV